MRRVSIATGTVTTIAGDGTQGCVDGFGAGAQFSSPVDVAVNAMGSFAVVVRNDDRGCEHALYVRKSLSSFLILCQVDSENLLVRTIDLISGRVATLSGQCNSPGFADGDRGSALFALPTGVAFIFDGSAAIVVRACLHASDCLRSCVSVLSLHAH